MTLSLELYNNHEHNKFWKSIVARAIVFYLDGKAGKWSVKMKEFTHSFDDVKEIVKIFSNK